MGDGTVLDLMSGGGYTDRRVTKQHRPMRTQYHQCHPPGFDVA